MESMDALWDYVIPLAMIGGIIVTTAGVTTCAVALIVNLMSGRQVADRLAPQPLLARVLQRPQARPSKKAVIHDDQALWQREQDEKKGRSV